VLRFVILDRIPQRISERSLEKKDEQTSCLGLPVMSSHFSPESCREGRNAGVRREIPITRITSVKTDRSGFLIHYFTYGVKHLIVNPSVRSKDPDIVL